MKILKVTPKGVYSEDETGAITIVESGMHPKGPEIEMTFYEESGTFTEEAYARLMAAAGHPAKESKLKIVK